MIRLEEVLSFFPKGSSVRALPDFSKPKMLIEDRGIQSRWNASSLLPATRLTAKLAKGVRRLQLGMGLQGERRSGDGSSSIADYLGRDLDSGIIQVLLGTPGPAQKAIIRVVDPESGLPLVFIKYASSEISKSRISQEFNVLQNLPEDLGPKALKLESLGAGLALMVSVLDGKQPRPQLPPGNTIVAFLNDLETNEEQSIEESSMLADLEEFSAYPFVRDTLSKRKWKKVFSHGDFAPWNIRTVGSRTRAFDWEYGSKDGLPYVDLSFYIQQVGALIYKWSPEKVRSVSTETLMKHYPQLDKDQATAFTLLAAMRSYFESEVDGHSAEFFIQPWRKAIWEDYS